MPLASARQHPENQKESQTGHSPEFGAHGGGSRAPWSPLGRLRLSCVAKPFRPTRNLAARTPAAATDSPLMCAPANGRPGFPFGFVGAGGRLPKARRGRLLIGKFSFLLFFFRRSMMAGRVFLVMTGACQFGHGSGGFTTNFVHSSSSAAATAISQGTAPWPPRRATLLHFTPLITPPPLPSSSSSTTREELWMRGALRIA